MHGWKRPLATVAVTLGFVATAAPVSAMTPAVDGGRCIDYGPVAAAPRGAIPRDDLATIRKDRLTKWVANHRRAARAAVQADGTIVVPVAFHIITKDGTLGNVPQTQVNAQIRVLNDGFKGTGFQFRLAETTRTVSPRWFKLFYAQGGEPRLYRGSHKEIQVKKALHSGDSETLNIYTAALGKRLLGWAYYPSSFTGADRLPRFYDGVVVDYRSLPGGAFNIYNEGDTVTHEVGHWLELAHTFQNGCEEPGDYVRDTPYEAGPQFYCEKRDSCPQPGMDPIHNFMDYTPDACMNHFTDGQAKRAQWAWEAYREVN